MLINIRLKIVIKKHGRIRHTVYVIEIQIYVFKLEINVKQNVRDIERIIKGNIV